MRLGRPTAPIVLATTERATLEQWARRRITAQALAQQARIVLACAEGQTNTAVAHHLRVTQQTVCKWRQRFLATRLEGLLDEPRPGAPRAVTDEDVERVVTQTLETTPSEEHARHGPRQRPEPQYSASHLARVRAAPASHRDIQALH